MSLLDEIRSLKPAAKDLRKFGLAVGGVFLVLGGWFLFRQKPYAWFCLVPGAVLFPAGLLWPASLRLMYLCWMALALVLGAIVSTLLLALFYFLVVTPIGWLARLAGKDFLSLKLDRGAPTYWVRKEKTASSPKDYEKQF